MNIYPAIAQPIPVTQSTQICFVYKWTQISTGKWYIGSRTAKNCHPNDGYTCSSKIVKPMIKEYPKDWNRIILETGSKDVILLLEHDLLTCLNAAYSEYSYNNSNGAGTFSNAGKKFSEETRNKMRKPKSLEFLEKRRIIMIGTHLSQKTKDKIKIARTGTKQSDITKNKRIEAISKLKWINNGESNKRVYDISLYPQWKTGRIGKSNQYGK